MQKVVPISYHGPRDVWLDNINGSGLTFQKGKPTLVPGHLVAKFLRYKEFKDARVGKAKNMPYDTTPPYVEKDEAPLVNLHTMTKEHISLYAKRNFNIELKDSMVKEDMVEIVRRQMGTDMPVGY
jgi:hypothetical protein